MEALEVNVEYFPEGGHLKKEERNFTLAKFMCRALRGKYVPPNFLYGEYAGKISNDAFLHAAGFMLSRTLSASIIIIIFLLFERFIFIYPAISKQDKINRKLLKDSQIALTSRERRKYRKSPDKILKKLRRDFKNVQQEVTTILSSTSISAFFFIISFK